MARAVATGVLIVVSVSWGCGVMGKSVERDASVYYLWAKRGQEMGDLAHVYCDQGGIQERQAFHYALDGAAVGAKVTIECPAPKKLFPRLPGFPGLE